jgi:enoyl-CoA hydratase
MKGGSITSKYNKYKGLSLNTREGGVAILTLNRPENQNAIDFALHTELEEIFVDINRDEGIRAVVLTGAGNTFSGGGDVESMDSDEWLPRGSEIPFRNARDLIRNLVDVRQPIVAAINGAAAGLAANMALFCDIIVMAEEARIGDPHVKIGLVAGDSGIVIWPLLIGLHRAKEMLLTGQMITGKTAAEWGLVNYAVPGSMVLPKAIELAKRLAEGAPLAIQWTKYCLNKILSDRANLVFDTSLFLEFQTFRSKDHKEAVQAFLEKRKPRFTGA